MHIAAGVIAIATAAITILYPLRSDAAPTTDVSSGRVYVSIQDVVLAVLEQNLNLKSLGMAVKMAATEIMFEKGAFDPTLFAEAGYTNQDYPISDILTGAHTEQIKGKAGIKTKLLFGTELEIGTEGNKLLSNAPVYFMRPEYRQKFYVNVVQPLLRGAGVDANQARIKLSTAQAEQEAENSRAKLIDVIYEVIKAYWDLYRTRESLSAAMDGLRMAERLYLDTKLRAWNGIVPEADIYQAFAEVHRRLADVIRAQQNARQADIVLKQAMSVPPESPLWGTSLQTNTTVPKKPISISESVVVDMARQYNPKIAGARAGIRGATATREWAANNRLPKLDIQAGLTFNGLSGEENATARQQGYSVPDKLKGGYGHGYDNVFDYPEWQIGLKFELPIPNRAGRAKYDKAVYGLERARLDERAAIIDAYAQATDIVPRLTALWAEVNARLAAVQYKKRQVDDETYKLKNGMGTTYDLLKMQAEYVEERERLAAASGEYMTAVGEIMKITGVVVLDPTSLDTGFKGG